MRDEEHGRRGAPSPQPDGMASDAVDSDCSISWEDFIGTTTDLVPQLLGMFDEIARGEGEHHAYVPAGLQKRLSLAQKRRSRASALYEMPVPAGDEENRPRTPVSPVEEEKDSPAQLRYGGGQRCRSHQPGVRPLSGSSIASSTSSSGCSNQGNASGAANPYLASVESLADTCASSQGSADSGVVTISESSGGGGGGVGVGGGVGEINGESGPGGVEGGGGGGGGANLRLSGVDRPTASRYYDECRPRYCDPQRNPVERVLLEIVDTEAIYVEHLRQVIQGYLIFWRDDPASLIRDLELNGLFSNIEDIFEFNRNFLSSLDNSGLDPIKVANTFIEHNTGFKVYTEYCTNYPRTVSILTDLMGQEEIAGAFRERQAALGHALPLGSFLLKPVQRILKYHLLLENLSKEFAAGSAGSEGRVAIEGALEAMTGIARHINAMKRKHEHAVRVQEIQSLLYGWSGPDLTTSGELIAEGSFRMRGAKAPRHAFLFDRMLLLTKKREDSLLVYKAHILCSNLTLMESIPGEPLSFHVIPFDNSQLQYKLQARDLEQKREWTLQIKRVILENYNAVIPSHARQLVLQIGQNRSEDETSLERSYKKSSEYYDSRKADRERRRSETGLRQKLKKGRKSDVSISTAENSPMCPRKNQSAESISHFGSRDDNLNRSSEIRGSKIKDRFTSWRRKSEPGFQSYIKLSPSDAEDDSTDVANESATPSQDPENQVHQEKHLEVEDSPELCLVTLPRTKEPEDVASRNGSATSQQSVEEIVGNILMQSHEFQKRLEKHQVQQQQRNLLNGHHRFPKSTSMDSTEEEEDTEDDEGKASRTTRFSRREQCFVRAVNAYNQRSFRSQYDSFRNVDSGDALAVAHRHSPGPTTKAKPRSLAAAGTGHEKRHSPPESFRKPNIGNESKVIRMALRIRESCDSASERDEPEEHIYETPMLVKKNELNPNDKGNFGNYDNLQRVWEGCLGSDGDAGAQDSPTKPAVWLTKLCEGLPDQPQKCGSLPRSFQMMHPADLSHVSKSRFLQRDGKSMTERPFTIASDKPAEINLEDMERYASSCQGSARIAKFPITGSSFVSSSTFFCSLDDASFTDMDSPIARTTGTLSASTHVHPDHKIYRANGSINKELGSSIISGFSGSSLRSALLRASSRLQQGLRSSLSTETLECGQAEESSKRGARQSRPGYGDYWRPYHRQGSPGLGARIAQADYADPQALFLVAEGRRRAEEADDEDAEAEEALEAADAGSFYEGEDGFRDSAIFSDGEEPRRATPSPQVLPKRRPRRVPDKPAPANKPAHLKLRAKIINCRGGSRMAKPAEPQDDDDVSAGQSQVGWVKKMVGQLQAQVDA